jgi:ComF family protein
MLLSVVNELLNWVYPSKCALCARFAESAICPDCKNTFRTLDDIPVKSSGALDSQFRLFRHEDRAAQAVRRLKYSRATALIKPLSLLIAEAIVRADYPPAAVVVPVPIHWSRRIARGFNQSEGLCESIQSRRVRKELLRRSRRTRSQVGLLRELRLANLENAFRALSEVDGMDIILVDDVATTGATGRACASALKLAGARQVHFLTLTAEP